VIFNKSGWRGILVEHELEWLIAFMENKKKGQKALLIHGNLIITGELLESS